MKRLSLITLLLLLMPISLVHASDGENVNLSEFPQQLASALGVSEFVGGLLASLILICLFLFPTLMVAGYFGGSGAATYASLIVGLTVTGICVGLGWLPVWIFAVLCLLIALLFGGKFANMFGGGGSP